MRPRQPAAGPRGRHSVSRCRRRSDSSDNLSFDSLLPPWIAPAAPVTSPSSSRSQCHHVAPAERRVRPMTLLSGPGAPLSELSSDDGEAATSTDPGEDSRRSSSPFYQVLQELLLNDGREHTPGTPPRPASIGSSAIANRSPSPSTPHQSAPLRTFAYLPQEQLPHAPASAPPNSSRLNIGTFGDIPGAWPSDEETTPQRVCLSPGSYLFTTCRGCSASCEDVDLDHAPSRSNRLTRLTPRPHPRLAPAAAQVVACCEAIQARSRRFAPAAHAVKNSYASSPQRGGAGTRPLTLRREARLHSDPYNPRQPGPTKRKSVRSVSPGPGCLPSSRFRLSVTYGSPGDESPATSRSGKRATGTRSSRSRSLSPLRLTRTRLTRFAAGGLVHDPLKRARQPVSSIADATRGTRAAPMRVSRKDHEISSRFTQSEWPAPSTADPALHAVTSAHYPSLYPPTSPHSPRLIDGLHSSPTRRSHWSPSSRIAGDAIWAAARRDVMEARSAGRRQAGRINTGVGPHR